MIINYVAETFGIRQIKQSLGFIAMGHSVYVYTKVFADKSFLPYFGNHVSTWGTKTHLEMQLKSQLKGDVYLVRFDLALHLPHAVADMVPDYPVWIDINDWYPQYTDDNVRGLAVADKVLMPCEGFRELIEPHTSADLHVVENRCPQAFYDTAAKLQPSGPMLPESIGYAGGVDSEVKHRDYQLLREACKGANINLYLLAPNVSEKDYKDYLLGGAVVLPGLEYFEMLRFLKRCTYIWAGSNQMVLKKVVRNALFDGLLTGRPVITCNLPDQSGRADVELAGLDEVKLLTRDYSLTCAERPILEDQLALVVADGVIVIG